MRLIDADKLAEELSERVWFKREDEKQAVRIVKEFPTVDAVLVVRCRDCKYYQKAEIDVITPHDMACAYAPRHHFYREPDEYCSKGKRKGGADDGE